MLDIEYTKKAFQEYVNQFDLHDDKDMLEGNIMTEYEEKFVSQGNKICKFIIYRQD